MVFSGIRRTARNKRDRRLLIRKGRETGVWIWSLCFNATFVTQHGRENSRFMVAFDSQRWVSRATWRITASLGIQLKALVMGSYRFSYQVGTRFIEIPLFFLTLSLRGEDTQYNYFLMLRLGSLSCLSVDFELCLSAGWVSVCGWQRCGLLSDPFYV